MERMHLASAGVVAALVGFASASVVVLTGLRAVGASPAQAASGLLAVTVAQGLGTVLLSRRHRIPVVLAWSTPGAALLASTGAVDGGWPAAVGAFLVVGGLILLTALWPRLGALIAAIPAAIAQAMLAGVLFALCLAPVHGLLDHPALVAPAVVTWLALSRLAPRWAVPAAFAVAMVAIGIWLARHGGPDGPLLPRVDLTAPTLTWASVLSLAVPLYIVTMASQNVPGVAVLASYGYTVPWRESMTVTGVGTVAGAFAGGHAINLAAITAALAASPEAHPDPRRRWLVANLAGWTHLVLALLTTALVTVITAAPAGVMTAVAGLALLGTLASSLNAALAEPADRQAAVVTFAVAASGMTLLGIGAAFWSLAAGLVVRATLRPFARPAPPEPAG
ncbi:benzoate/H(+) symporter BenE family transporter [Frankia sp. CNm7]|uniref:Benzoate/H(+) symporter BenE family transporter n=2 Tax=Frankia nepalensis TaxID=1836974 RepID=A0A937UQZ7_9ACTN|nr:benzoate/H(+) symporter BenE family transporter [Frankia nepalensis]MBL7499251.1 benzoate/H(+) symporter BenE family transporter [Frankia nepalensis]MBL7512034.1 benzoate/H(+) symporter BenE family transporter [Frankia nepalensis]MBL7518272.1 benzoate/H(+) symporter BenE family transporter [Frankia nepalensis]MBL7628755.1 benzoate/H(+) symporter BenE family transporter [Frankia nepalensis]